MYKYMSISSYLALSFFLCCDSDASGKGSKAVLPAADQASSTAPRRLLQDGDTIKSKGYATHLVCHGTLSAEDSQSPEMKELTFSILANTTEIGSIGIQYYPQGGFYQTNARKPLFRLRNIDIAEPFQKRGHGTEALNLLFAKLLKLNPDFPEGTEVAVEYSIMHTHLTRWYKKFGLPLNDAENATRTDDVRVRSALITGLKFPKSKATASAAAARSADAEAPRTHRLPVDPALFRREGHPTAQRGRVFGATTYSQEKSRYDVPGSSSVFHEFFQPEDLSTLTAGTVQLVGPGAIGHVDYDLSKINLSKGTSTQEIGFRFTPNPMGITGEALPSAEFPQDVYASIAFPINDTVSDMELSIRSSAAARAAPDYAATVSESLSLVFNEIWTIRKNGGLRNFSKIILRNDDEALGQELLRRTQEGSLSPYFFPPSYGIPLDPEYDLRRDTEGAWSLSLNLLKGDWEAEPETHGDIITIPAPGYRSRTYKNPGYYPGGRPGKIPLVRHAVAGTALTEGTLVSQNDNARVHEYYDEIYSDGTRLWSVKVTPNPGDGTFPQEWYASIPVTIDPFARNMDLLIYGDGRTQIKRDYATTIAGGLALVLDEIGKIRKAGNLPNLETVTIKDNHKGLGEELKRWMEWQESAQHHFVASEVILTPGHLGYWEAIFRVTSTK